MVFYPILSFPSDLLPLTPHSAISMECGKREGGKYIYTRAIILNHMPFFENVMTNFMTVIYVF